MAGRPGLAFRLKRWVTFLLQGMGRKEKEHYLFALSTALDSFTIFDRLARRGWQPNIFGYVYRHQVYQARRLVSGRHQYHIRFYRHGSRLWVTGHFETTAEWSTRRHLAGKDLRTMDKTEAVELAAGLEADSWQEY
jgi:hypothetical protein